MRLVSLFLHQYSGKCIKFQIANYIYFFVIRLFYFVILWEVLFHTTRHFYLIYAILSYIAIFCIFDRVYSFNYMNSSILCKYDVLNLFFFKIENDKHCSWHQDLASIVYHDAYLLPETVL